MTSEPTSKKDNDHSEGGHLGHREVIHCPGWRDGGGRGGGGGGGGEHSSRLELLQEFHVDGVFSTTYKCRDLTSRKQYLVKRVHLQNMMASDVSYRLQELQIWTKLRHRHVLTCLTGWQSGVAELWLLSDSAEDTVDRLVKEKGQPPPQPLFENWLFQLASALQYLHNFQERPILHRNFKPSNIMVVPHYILKVADFGFSKELRDGEDMTATCVGSAIIMSPEMVKRKPYSFKTDMWGLGITAVYLATMQAAVAAHSFDTLFTKTIHGQIQGIGGQYSTDIEKLVNTLLQVDPTHRPSASQFITDLYRCSNHCTTSATADSYPARPMVPQNSSALCPSPQNDATPRSRLGTGSKLSADKVQRFPQLPAREKQSPTSGEDVADAFARWMSRKPDARENVAKSAACQTTPSLLLRRQDSAKRPRNPALSVTGANVVAPSRGQRPMTWAPASTRVPSVESLSLSLVYMVVDRRNRQPRSASPVPDRADGFRRQSAVNCQTAVKQSQTLPTAAGPTATLEQRDAQPGEAQNSSGSKEVVPKARLAEDKGPASSQPPRGKGSSTPASGKRTTLRAKSVGETTPASSQRQSQGGNTRDHDDDESTRHDRGSSPASPKDVHADEDQEDCDEVWDEDIDTVTLTSDSFTSDTPTSELQMISTFPGAFKVTRVLPTDPHLSLGGHALDSRDPQLPGRRGGGDGPKSKTNLPRCLSESDTSRQQRHHGQGRRREAWRSAPIDTWPEPLRDYWNLANDLVESLGVNTFFTALKYVSLFSEGEVRQWLRREKGLMETAGECMDSLNRLLDLDAQLDADIVRAFNNTLREQSHSEEDPA